MRKITFLFVALLMTFNVFADDITVTDDGSGVGTTTWTADNVYLLDGFVFVNDGQVLTIEAGTTIKGKPGQGESASALIVAMGGKLIANGTADMPIIFTAEADDGTMPTTVNGQWGGLIMLGKATTNNATLTKQIEGIPTTETRAIYGGEDDADGSGMLHYVSIRHGGTDIGEGNEINGITLGACGSNTKISYLEVVANKDDGVEFFGGLPRLDHILVAYVGDDSYDYDEGYRGYGQFWATIQFDADGDRMGEHDGGPSDCETCEPYAHPIIHNATYIGVPGEGRRVITLRDNAGGEYRNSIFAEQDKGIDIEFVEESDDSWSQWKTNGNLILADNIFQNVADGSAEKLFAMSVPKDDNDNPKWEIPEGYEAEFSADFAAQNNSTADVGVSVANPVPTGDVSGANFDGAPSWFTRVTYKGAFAPGNNWAGGWTLAYPDATAGDEITVTDDGSGVGTTTWTANNTYLLDGFVFVNDGQTLTIEAGTTIKGKPGQGESASALIVAQGGTLIAVGTATDPIVFTAEADDGTMPTTVNGQWGGLIMLGKANTNNATLTKQIEGIPTTETRAIYGGEDDMDGSGQLSFVSIRHGGTDIGEGNEINGLTLGACGKNTMISHVEVVANKDDGVEFFGGMPMCDHILVAFVGDDSYDYDEGYSGYGQFWATVQFDADGDRMGEHDGGPSDCETCEPYAHPIIHNATYIGVAGEGRRVFTMRDNAGGEYRNSIFAEQDKGIDIEFVEESDDSWSQWKTNGNIIIADNIFQNVADGSAEKLFAMSVPKDDNDNPKWDIPEGYEAEFAADFAAQNNSVADVGVSVANPVPTGDVSGPDYTGAPAWFDRVDYKGAFAPGSMGIWAGGWTLAYADMAFLSDDTETAVDRIERKEASVYPNPIARFATVDFEYQAGEVYTFKVYNLAGMLVREINNITTGEFNFNRGNLESGLYIYDLSNKSGVTLSGKLLMK